MKLDKKPLDFVFMSFVKSNGNRDLLKGVSDPEEKRKIIIVWYFHSGIWRGSETNSDARLNVMSCMYNLKLSIQCINKWIKIAF